MSVRPIHASQSPKTLEINSWQDNKYIYEKDGNNIIGWNPIGPNLTIPKHINNNNKAELGYQLLVPSFLFHLKWCSSYILEPDPAPFKVEWRKLVCKKLTLALCKKVLIYCEYLHGLRNAEPARLTNITVYTYCQCNYHTKPGSLVEFLKWDELDMNPIRVHCYSQTIFSYLHINHTYWGL